MIARRHFVALAVLAMLALVAAAVVVWRVVDRDENVSLVKAIAVNATLTPEQHQFGDPVRARVEIILDSGQIDPESVRLQANFAPYRPLQPPTREEDAAGGIGRIRFDYRLACLRYQCLPVGRRQFELRNATVAYARRTGERRVEEIDWPTLTASGRISPTRFWEAQTRAEFRQVEPPAYSVSPRLVAGIGLLLAIGFAGAAVILLLRQLPLVRIAERLGLKTVDRRTALERALARVRETSSAEQAEEGRRALERLAHELRRARNPKLAWAASELAWSREFPADGRLTRLSGEVERLIKERA